MEYLTRLMTQDFPLPEAIRAVILEMAKKVHYKVDTILVQQGQPDLYLYIIKRGALRAYSYDSEGKEHTYWVATEHELVFSPNEFMLNRLSPETIEAIEDTELYELPKIAWLAACGIHKKLEIIHKSLLEKCLSEQEMWKKLLRITPYKSRIRQFYDYYPHFRNRIPQKYIASWLNMDKATFSRLQKEIHKDKPPKNN